MNAVAIFLSMFGAVFFAFICYLTPSHLKIVPFILAAIFVVLTIWLGY